MTGSIIDLSYDGMTEEDYIEYIGEEFGFEGSEIRKSSFVYVLECHESTKEELKENHRGANGIPDQLLSPIPHGKALHP